MSKIILATLILLGTLIPGLGYVFWGYPWIGLGVILVGLLWLAAQWRGRGWFSHLGMAATAAAVAAAATAELWPQPSSWGMLVGLICTLAAWDLAQFQDRLRLAAPQDDTRPLETAHLRNLAGYAIAGLLLGGLTTILKVELRLVDAVILTVIAFAGMMQLARWFRKSLG